MKTTKHTKLTDIPNLNYEGYIWKSDQSNPEVYNNETIEFNKIELNPFIIEGLLYCKANNISVHIQHTGEYLIHVYDLNSVSENEKVEKRYLPHRLDGIEKVKFTQVWSPKKDELCEGMEVLKLKATIFCGFEKK